MHNELLAQNKLGVDFNEFWVYNVSICIAIKERNNEYA